MPPVVEFVGAGAACDTGAGPGSGRGAAVLGVVLGVVLLGSVEVSFATCMAIPA